MDTAVKEKKIYTLRTKGPNPIEYYVSFNDEPLDFSRPARLFTMMARDLARERFSQKTSI